MEHLVQWNETSEECGILRSIAGTVRRPLCRVIARVLASRAPSLRVPLRCVDSDISPSAFLPLIIFWIAVTTRFSSSLERFSFGRLTERARLREARKVARPQNNRGGFPMTGQCDLPPRTASPERSGESSRSSGSDCAAHGGWPSGRAVVCH